MYALQVSSWKSERHHPQRLVHLQLWCRILISRALVAPRFNTNTMKHSIAYRGSVLWNSLTRMPWVITPVTVSQSPVHAVGWTAKRSHFSLAREWQGKWGDPASSLHSSLSSWKKQKRLLHAVLTSLCWYYNWGSEGPCYFTKLWKSEWWAENQLKSQPKGYKWKWSSQLRINPRCTHMIFIICTSKVVAELKHRPEQRGWPCHFSWHLFINLFSTLVSFHSTVLSLQWTLDN